MKIFIVVVFVAALFIGQAISQNSFPSSSEVRRIYFVGASAKLASGDRYSPGIFVAVRNPCRDQDFTPCGGRGGLYAFESDGTEFKWKLDEISDSAGPVVRDGTVYLADNGIYAINGRTGAVIWRATSGSGVNDYPPVIDRSTVYFWQINRLIPIGTFGGTLVAVDLKTHHVKWTYPIGEGYVSQITVGSRAVYFVRSGSSFIEPFGSASNSWLNAVNSASGKLIWKVKSSGGINPVVFGKSVHTTGHTGSLDVYDQLTGKRSHSADITGWNGEPGIVAGNLVYSFSPGTPLMAFDLIDLKTKWQSSVVPSSLPLLLNRKLYFGSEDKYLYSVDSSTGETLWKVLLPNEPTSSPVYLAGRLYLVCGDGYLYEINLKAS